MDFVAYQQVLIEWGPPAGILSLVLVGVWKMFNRGLDAVTQISEKNRDATDKLAEKHQASLEGMEARHREERDRIAERERESAERQARALDGVAEAMLELAKKNGNEG